jgi:hypothetical protein
VSKKWIKKGQKKGKKKGEKKGKKKRSEKRVCFNRTTGMSLNKIKILPPPRIELECSGGCTYTNL